MLGGPRWASPLTAWQRAGAFVGMAFGVLGAVGVGSIIPSARVRPALSRTRTLPRAMNALMGGAVVALLAVLSDSWWLTSTIAMLTVALLLGFSRAFTPASRLTFVNALIVGCVGALVAAMIAPAWDALRPASAGG